MSTRGWAIFLSLVGAVAAPASAGEAPPKSVAVQRDARIPRILSDSEREAFRAVFRSIRAGSWADAQARLDALPNALLTPFARAELYTAKGSPKVELPQLQALLAIAPDLPQADQIGRIAKLRGAAEPPVLPVTQRLVWNDGAPTRGRASPTRGDAAADALALKMVPFIKDDRAADAEALLASSEATLSPAARTEWRARVAWIYYLTGDDRNARRMAATAADDGSEWASGATWTDGLAAWRAGDCVGAVRAFDQVGRRAADVELRAAGHYWSARADMRCARPEGIQAKLRAAAQFDETFYGQLARETLGIAADLSGAPPVEWAALEKNRNVRVAAALAEIGEARLAEEVLRHQARIGDRDSHAALIQLAGRLNLPSAQLWLTHNTPQGINPPMASRYPTPDWTPDDGWRVDKSLLFAHALQESRFRTDVVSPAGAYGLMQIMPAAATDFSRKTGLAADRDALTRPAFNMAVGQSHLEALRDRAGTGGLLPKVIAAYNAGPAPVDAWNATTRDKGDPLLYIESIPYWETRGYVTIVLRNYWMYQQKAGEQPASRSALAQGMWPRFPGLSGKTAVRLDTASGLASAD